MPIAPALSEPFSSSEFLLPDGLSVGQPPSRKTNIVLPALCDTARQTQALEKEKTFDEPTLHPRPTDRGRDRSDRPAVSRRPGVRDRVAPDRPIQPWVDSTRIRVQFSL